MERGRKEIDKGKSKFPLASSRNIHSQIQSAHVKKEEKGSVTSKTMKRPKFGQEIKESMKQKKDGSSPTTKAGAASQYAFSKFKGNPEHAESSKPLCLYCNGRIDSESMLTCTKCIPLLKRTGKALDIASKNNHIPVKESGAPKSIRLRQSVRTGQSRIRVCEICCERKETFDMSRNEEACRHSICTTCISKHIQVKVESNSGKILCPGLHCRVALALDRCKEFLPENVAERWEKTIVETMIPDSEKFYCPFNDCSAMLLDENEEEKRMMRESECPHCRRLFCVQCLVPWHAGMECREFQRQNPVERGRDDIKLKKLADEKEWMRCPECKSYVEKTEGCVTVTCRCRCQFCYRCGEKWSVNHGVCQRGGMDLGYRP